MSRTLSMSGQIDSVFRSGNSPIVMKVESGSYINGIFVPGAAASYNFNANIQPLNMREIDFLNQGGERVIDPRKVYINNGNLDAVVLGAKWEFFGQKWKTVKLDNRPHNSYCKVIVDRIDPQ